MKFACLVAMAVALAPIAAAQDCEQIERLVAAGQDAFDSIAGDPVGDGFFESDVWMRDADDCSIDSIETRYYCMWEASTVADADKAIAPLYDMAKVCLSKGWEWADIAGQPSGDGMTITEGYTMTKVSGANRDATVSVYMDSKPGQPWRQVWLDVTGE